ncbi:MAG TPA: hypothetical protein DD638_02520 [Pasteurellaceae bacterium]|nr:hypothetical protein [Pasteurellaceae bacterium]
MVNSKICDFNFQISQWNIVCNKIISDKDWKLGEQHWYKNSHEWEDYSPKLAFLPALKRRRLSDSARLFFEAAWDIVEQDADLPVVYASLNSEVNRSFALWKTLLQEGDISPTSFSLSVHNALIGQWSELCQVKNEVTSLTARQDNLEIALMEAYLLLNEGYSKVLVVIAESPLYEQYNAKPVKRQPFSYALAMVVEPGKQYQLSLCSDLSNICTQDNALTWVKNQYLNQFQWKTESSTGGIWKWQKN